jgi:hypothetical protein
MAIPKSIEAHNILLFNFYTLLLIQLLFNWNITNCGNKANLWKFFFLIILYARLFLDEMYNNQKINQKIFRIVQILTAVALAILAAVMIAIIIGN